MEAIHRPTETLRIARVQRGRADLRAPQTVGNAFYELPIDVGEEDPSNRIARGKMSSDDGADRSGPNQKDLRWAGTDVVEPRRWESGPGHEPSGRRRISLTPGFIYPGRAGHATFDGVPARSSRRRFASEVGGEQTVPWHTNATGPAFASFVFRIETTNGGT